MRPFTLIRHVIIIALLLLAFFSLGSTLATQAQTNKVFTAEELSQFDGKDGRKAYYAYEGKVYDVTGSKLWAEGQHFGLQAGQDLTGKMGDAPHGTEVFAGFTVVGSYGSTPVVTQQPAAQPSVSVIQVQPSAPQNEQPTRSWFEGRIRIIGISILGWTGILLGIFFVLTFATCFAMPWAKLPLPWAGGQPGPDKLDALPKHMTWSYIHKYFVWFTVILGVVHGILGFLQLLGIYV